MKVVRRGCRGTFKIEQVKRDQYNRVEFVIVVFDFDNRSLEDNRYWVRFEVHGGLVEMKDKGPRDERGSWPSIPCHILREMRKIAYAIIFGLRSVAGRVF